MEIEVTDVLPGIFLWTGPYGSGKTTACLECGAEPSQIDFWDADIKGNKTVKELRQAGYEFGRYVNLAKIISEKGHEAYNDIWELVETMPEQIKIVIIDPETEIYRVFRRYVRENEADFDAPKMWKKARGSGFKFYEGKISRHARKEEQRLLNTLSSQVMAVHMTAHLTDKYDGGAVVGKVPDVTRMIDRTINMAVWLQHNPDSSTPIMLFIKQLGQKRYKEGVGLRTVNITPRKAIPRPDEESVWDVIHRYMEHPAHNRPPTEDEQITEEDRWIVDQTLTDYQKQAWFARIRAEEKREQEALEELEELDNPFNKRVRELQKEGVMAPAKIVEIIKDEIAEGELAGVDAELVTIDNVVRLL